MISRTLSDFIANFDFGRAAEQHLRVQRVKQVRHPDGRVETTHEIIEATSGALKGLVSDLPATGQWEKLSSAVARFAGVLDPSTWPIVLIEISPRISMRNWLGSGLANTGLRFYDAENPFSEIFGSFQGSAPGLSLERFGLVAVRVPPTAEMISWLDNPNLGIAGLWLGDETVSIPEPQEDVSEDQLWDGHDLVLNKTPEGQYPKWFDPKTAGKGVTIAVLDTGIAVEHNAFRGGKVVGRVDFTGNGQGDRNGHGTHCAGIAAAAPYGNGRFMGVAPAAGLLDVKVLSDRGTGLTTWILMGIEWAVRRGAKVISMSLASDTSQNDGTSPLSRAVQYVVEKEGVFVSVAAGNSGPRPGSIGMPADARDACTVGAVDRGRKPTDFSSRGPTKHIDSGRFKPDICAPGVGIAGPAAPGSFRYPGRDPDARIALSGTSMATPFVAGVASVLLSKAGAHLSPIELKKRVAAKSNPALGPGADDPFICGKGIVSLHNLMKGTGGVSMNNASGGLKRFAKFAAAMAVVGVLAYFAWPQISSLTKPRPGVHKPATSPTPISTGVPSTPDTATVPPQVTDTQPQVQNPGEVAIWKKPDCCEFNPAEQKMWLRVYRGMTLSDLAVHFSMPVKDIRELNPTIHGDRIQAGSPYVIPTAHLKAIRHTVRQGETLYSLTQKYDLPTLYSIRTWNCLPSVRLKAGDELLIFQPLKPQPTVASPGTQEEKPAFATPASERWRKPGVYEFEPESGLLCLQVYRGMTLSELALHFRLDIDDIQALNPSLANGKILAGRKYWIPTEHLKAIHYTVQSGDTLGKLARKFNAPTVYTIRTWNGLASNRIRQGQTLLIFQ